MTGGRAASPWFQSLNGNWAQSLFMAARKPEVELYDLREDPHEIHNLAGSAAHRKDERRLAGILDGWMKETRDQGARQETAKEAAL